MCVYCLYEECFVCSDWLLCNTRPFLPSRMAPRLASLRRNKTEKDCPLLCPGQHFRSCESPASILLSPLVNLESAKTSMNPYNPYHAVLHFLRLENSPRKISANIKSCFTCVFSFLSEHCVVEYNGDAVVLHPKGPLCSVDGIPISEPTKLPQGL